VACGDDGVVIRPAPSMIIENRDVAASAFARGGLNTAAMRPLALRGPYDAANGRGARDSHRSGSA